MKLLKNRGFAVAVLIVTIVLSSLYGLSKKPEAALPAPQPEPELAMGLSTAAFEPYIVDDAKILSTDTEKRLSLYNANWDSLGGSILAVVTTNHAGDIVDAAWDWADDMELGENDAVLLMDPAAADSYLLSFGTFAERFSGRESTYLTQYLYEDFQKEQYDAGVLALFEQIHANLFAAAQPPAEYPGGADTLSVISAVIPILLLLIVLVVLFNVIDSMRYTSWNRRYGSMGVPPVIYRPIFWWHRPGSAWFRRRRTPPPPRPPRPSVTPRPPMGTGPRPPRPPVSSSPRPPRPAPPHTGGGGFGRGGGFRGSSFGGGGFNSRGGGFRGSPRSGGGGFRSGGPRGRR